MAEMSVNQTYMLRTGGTTIARGCFAVHHTSAGQCTNPAGASAGKTVGALVDSSLAAGEAGNFCKFGYAYLCAYDGSIAIGDDLIIADTAGRVKAKGIGSNASGTDIVARAEEASSAQGDLILCFVNVTAHSS